MINFSCLSFQAHFSDITRASVERALQTLDADHPMLTPQGRAAAIALDEAINELRRIIRTERLDPETGEIIYATKTEEELN